MVGFLFMMMHNAGLRLIFKVYIYNLKILLLSIKGEEKLDRDEAEEVINDCGQPYKDEVDYKGNPIQKLNLGALVF